MGGVLKPCFVLPKANLKQLTEDALTKCQHILVTDCIFFFLCEKEKMYLLKKVLKLFVENLMFTPWFHLLSYQAAVALSKQRKILKTEKQKKHLA